MRFVDATSLLRKAPLLLLLALGSAHCSSDDSTSSGSAGSATGGNGGTGGAAAGSAGSGGAVDGGSDAPAMDAGAGLGKLNHVVVIYLENWSFDSLYGEFEGAEGLSSAAATAAPKQIDVNGTAYMTLPQVEPALGGGDAGDSWLLSQPSS